MTARLCYLCGKKWAQPEEEMPLIFCPACRRKEEQRDLTRLKEATRGTS